jgi:hypothetical protein
MKGAAALPIAPGFEQPRLPPDQTGQGRAGTKLIKETGGQGHGEGSDYTFAGKSGARAWARKNTPYNKGESFGASARVCALSPGRLSEPADF